MQAISALECYAASAITAVTVQNTIGVLKAGYMSEDILTDYFYNVDEDSVTLLPSRRVVTGNTYGTGCTLSSAFAAALAKGNALTQTARASKCYIEQAIISGSGYDIGNGHGPVDHFFAIRSYS